MRIRFSTAAVTTIAMTAAGLVATAGPAAATATSCAASPGVVIDDHSNDSGNVPAILQGTEGDDIIYGHGGDDIIYGYGGNDEIHAGDGDDVVYGGRCDDALYGGEGYDILVGSSGVDTLYGYGGDDGLLGDSTDTLIGGPGANYCDTSGMSQSGVESSFTYIINPYTFRPPATAYPC